jgi:DNA polymerase
MDANHARTVVRQQLRADELLGVRSLPFVLRPIAPRGAVDRRVDAASAAEKEARLRRIDEEEVRGCTRCALCDGRTQTVFGQGSPAARLVFVGEGPGQEEDRQGLAFVGKAGQLLTRMIQAMGLSRDDVFICNVVKCRPPNNRTPTADEMLACSPFLWRQLRIIDPEVIVALGSPAAKTLLGTAESIGRLRGRFHDCYLSGTPGEGPSVPLMPTYHPAYLLRSPEEKGKVWADLQVVMKQLGLPLPAGRGG